MRVTPAVAAPPRLEAVAQPVGDRHDGDLATFMEVLDTSIANVALPHIAGNLSISEDEATWVLTSYLVANAVILPISAWLSTKFGRKRFYMTCVVHFRRQFADVRLGSELAGAGVFPRPAGTGGRRPRAHGTSDSGRHIRRPKNAGRHFRFMPWRWWWRR